MKNISLALNVVLAIAVAILYYFHFTTNSSQNAAKKNIEVAISDSTSSPINVDNNKDYLSKVGYINVDSLQINYGLYDELKAKIEAKQKRYEKDLSAKSEAFQRKVAEFQKKAPTMSQFEGQMKQKELGEEQQKLYKLDDEYSAKFQNELLKLNTQLYKSIKDFINEHNKDKYDIIIGESQTRNFVLDFNEKIDITTEILDGLNKEYNAKKEQK